MIDHFSLQASDFAAALAFYTAALKPLGIAPQYVNESAKSAGFGPPRRGESHWLAGGSLWLSEGKAREKTHLAFRAPNREAVSVFHAAALRAGGKDNGKPGLRADYHPTYYAAFVIDPDGNNIEAVTHDVK